MENLVLVLNCGSSSIKFALINPASEQTIGSGIKEQLDQNKYDIALNEILTEIKHHENIQAIGHRVVHGGEKFTASALIDDNVLAAIDECAELAPLHNPNNLLGIKATLNAYPKLPQVAVFDTAFHQTLPEHAFLYAIPYELYQEHHIRRYGFHGTSHRFVAKKSAERLNIPLENSSFITAHLGNGCSAAAILNGKSADTTMGLTPLEGLVMGTRSGDVDPGLHAYLASSLNYSITEIDQLLNKKSGLLGISKLSNDMRTLSDAAKNGNKLAAMAREIFSYRLAKAIMALHVPLSHKVDALVFTGGIGENDIEIRERVTQLLPNNLQTIVIPTNEELLIAQDALELGVKQ